MSTTNPANPKTDLIYDFLQEHPGCEFYPAEIAERLGLTIKQTQNGLRQLYVAASKPGIRHPARGGWQWQQPTADELAEAGIALNRRHAPLATIAGPADWPHLAVPDHLWEETGDESPASRLSVSFYLNGAPIHLEAREVTWIDGEQTAVGDWPEDLGHLYAIAEPGQPFDTVAIRSREYVILAYSY